MKLYVLLKLQWMYAIFAIFYNVISFVMLRLTEKALAPTNPIAGIVAMLIYVLFLLTATKGKMKLYRGCMLVAFLFLTYNGVVKHILNVEKIDLYSSYLAWFFAILINLFGSILNFISCLGLFKKS